MGLLNLVGDGIHNFTDGIIVAASFLVSIPLGIVTAIAVAAHEVPQEIGDFAVLIYSGFSRTKALFFNFLAALTVIIGAVVTYYFAHVITNITVYLIPFSAGGFIYIACADLMGDLKKEPNARKATMQLIMFLIGIGIIWLAMKLIAHH